MNTLCDTGLILNIFLRFSVDIVFGPKICITKDLFLNSFHYIQNKRNIYIYILIISVILKAGMEKRGKGDKKIITHINMYLLSGHYHLNLVYRCIYFLKRNVRLHKTLERFTYLSVKIIHSFPQFIYLSLVPIPAKVMVYFL